MTVLAEHNSTAIRPFRVNFADERLTELRRRILATQWPTMRELARHWATDYDIEESGSHAECVSAVHHEHRRPRHSFHPRPLEARQCSSLVISHGWPGSVLEQVKLIERLTDPTAHGGKAEDAFDVVIPSMPGYGFSGKPTGGNSLKFLPRN